MKYTGLELYMEKLKKMIYCNDNPFINNHPEILCERPRIRLLYEELNSMINIMYVGNNEQLNDLKTIVSDLVEEANSIVGLYVYQINYQAIALKNLFQSIEHIIYAIGRFRRHGLIHDMIQFYTTVTQPEPEPKPEHVNIEDLRRAIRQNLDHVIRQIRLIKKFLDSSRGINHKKIQPPVPGTSCTRIPFGMKKVLEERAVGLARDVDLIRDQLVQDKKNLDVVSIIGMGGIGKTTLATMIFNDPFVVYHFHERAWVTVSQTYTKRDLLIQILLFMDCQLDLAIASYSQLREKLHKSLMGKRYLIVVDDIWSVEAWNDLKPFLPNNPTGSRILLTSRLKEVALQATSQGFVHQLEYLTDQESWELLCKKVFPANDCPKSLIKPGKQIAKNCHGLPLAVVVIAGVLTKEAANEDLWERIGQSVNSYIVNDPSGYVETLALSYDHLPPHLRDCFLYLGGFPEDHKFGVTSLIWLWMAEGFIQESGNRSLEEIGEDYLMELVDRNLVVVADQKFDGSIKAISVHDLLREFCLKKGIKENFFMKIPTQTSSVASMKPRRKFINDEFVASVNNNVFKLQEATYVQSLFLFHSHRSMSNYTNCCLYPYPLLMVLDLQMCRLAIFPESIKSLVHLRYLAFWCIQSFPSSICNLWSLQTLIVRSFNPIILPKTISNLVNLKHLKNDRIIHFRSIKKPMNLQFISKVALVGGEKWEKYIPAIKKLTCSTRVDEDHNFESLTSLKTLMWITVGLASVFDQQAYPNGELRKMYMRLPASLKKLSLAGCCLPWSDMSIIQSLPNLEVLKILDSAFVGPRWETGEEQFQQLKFMKLQCLDIQEWKASDINFPCLQQLVVGRCNNLEGIPLELGDIPTLERIDVDKSSTSVVASLDRIREEQSNVGNLDLKINVRNVLSNLSTFRKLRGVH